VTTILVVDDEAESAEVLGIVLEDEGFRTVLAINGEEGLARLRDEQVGLVVIDYVMPVMNGAEMVKALRDAAETASIPILLNSSLAEEEIRRHVTSYDAFLRKPYELDVALGVIRRLLATS
jgi:CheY-like chemotaxis protein